jgi:predicted ATPase/DNA-binding CsgD family transcriptional regulator
MAASTSTRRAGNLPSELTTFVGRRREVAQIRRLLSASRLVTLTGVGGAGKTRLSLRVASELHRAFPDGVWFVELAALEDQAVLSQTVASALGVHDRTARWPTPALADYLRSKQLLLVLDNCEHLRDACAIFADTMLRAAPDVRIMATSRQPLGLTGEHTFQVPTMSVPEADRIPPPEAVSQYEAVSLFADRAVAVQPNFSISESNIEAVVRVCQRLDGIPLAIELTAVRLRALSINEILERLEDRYTLLTSGSPGALPRHQTLRALIDWSSGLCSAEERTLWARLSVFSGGFHLAAAEKVCAGGDLAEEAVLDLLSSLVDKSIVIADEHAGRVRYRMLETLRQYGHDLLREQGTETGLRERHRDHFGALVEQACEEWLGPRQTDWLGRLSREHDNLRAALEFCLTEPGEAEEGLRIAGALWFYCIATGLTSEGRRWLERGIQLETRPSTWRARALWVCAYLCILQEDLTSAGPMITECQRHADQLGDPHAAAWAVQLSGMAAMSEGDLGGARRLLEDGLERHRAVEHPIGVLDDSFYLVAVTALLNDLQRAQDLCEQALALCDTHGERWLKSYMLWDMGLVAWQLGESQRAAGSGRDGLRLARDFNEQWAIAFGIELLAWTANAEGRDDRAARLLGGADSIWRRIGAPLFGMRHFMGYHDNCVALVRKALGVKPYDKAFRSGARMSTEETVAYGLEEREHAASVDAAAPADALSLTPRENEVADLIAAGLSNKAIAARLVIAQRTAEAHVEHILGKLGFSSRAQVAAWVTEQRAAESDDVSHV